MRVLLLLSAFLTAMIGPLGATAASVQAPRAACAVERAPVRVSRAYIQVVVARAHAVASPEVIAPLTDAPAMPVARYAMRLRV